ncbi:MAG: serine esterase [Verrucomicrobia bacterium]|nr:serine esterase [Verrucomicrobiota bacterium]
MLKTVLIPAHEHGSRRLLVVLHGLGDSVEGYRWMPREMGLPWLNYLLVNAPDEYYGGYSWYDIYEDPDPGVQRSRRLLFELLDKLPERDFPHEQVMMFGFSQGCVLTIETAARYPRRLAGFVGVSGYVHGAEELIRELSPVAREQRILMTHGTRDPLIPIAPVRVQVERLRNAGMQIEWREFTKAHEIAGWEELELIRQFIGRCFGKEAPEISPRPPSFF